MYIARTMHGNGTMHDNGTTVNLLDFHPEIAF